jgi:hypothetical protein
MKSELEILEMVRTIYRDIGGDPSELASVRPLWGGWLNALTFEVVRVDNSVTRLSRVDIDSANRRRLTKAVKAFLPSTVAQRGAARTPSPTKPRTWRGLDRDAVAGTTKTPAPEKLASGIQTRLLLLCGSCSVECQHRVTLAEHTSTQLVVVAHCQRCGATIRLALTGEPRPGRTIADRLKRAIRLSARHAAKQPNE